MAELYNSDRRSPIARATIAALPIKEAVRLGEGLADGDTVTVSWPSAHDRD